MRRHQRRGHRRVLCKSARPKFGSLICCCTRSLSRPKKRSKAISSTPAREAFTIAHDISAYSLVALSRAAAPLMTDGGSIVAMSYYGAEKVVPHYNVMGVAKASARSQHALSRLRSGPEKNPRELHQRRAGEHPRGARHQRLLANAQALRGTLAAQARCVARRTRRRPACSSPATARPRSPARCIYVDGGYQIMGM